jgi:hypothetical protein
MFYDYKVGIYNKAQSIKVDGITIPGIPTYIKDIDCDIQPYSRTLLIKGYGYDIEVTNRLFMDFDANVKIGTILYYTNSQNVIEKYEVKAIIPWDYLEVMCFGL